MQEEVIRLHREATEAAVRVEKCTPHSMARQRATYARELAEKRFIDYVRRIMCSTQ